MLWERGWWKAHPIADRCALSMANKEIDLFQIQTLGYYRVTLHIEGEVTRAGDIDSLRVDRVGRAPHEISSVLIRIRFDDESNSEEREQ